MRAKVIVIALLATLAIASSASAAVPSGYDEHVIMETVMDWRQIHYDEGVYMPRVTRLEVRHGGCEDNVPDTIIIEGE